MDNAQKAIMIGVGLFITIIIIAIVMVITGMGQDLANNATNQLGQMSDQLQKSLTQEYDGTTLSGTQVLAAVKKYLGDSNMAIELHNNASSPTQAGGLVVSGTNKVTENSTIPQAGDFSNRTKTDTYIVPTAKYYAELLRVNDAVVGIKFTKK